MLVIFIIIICFVCVLLCFVFHLFGLVFERERMKDVQGISYKLTQYFILWAVSISPFAAIYGM